MLLLYINSIYRLAEKHKIVYNKQKCNQNSKASWRMFNLQQHLPPLRYHLCILFESSLAFSTPKDLEGLNCCWAIDCRPRCIARTCGVETMTELCRTDPSSSVVPVLLFIVIHIKFVGFRVFILGSLMIMPFWLLLCVFFDFFWCFSPGLCSRNIFHE